MTGDVVTAFILGYKIIVVWVWILLSRIVVSKVWYANFWVFCIYILTFFDIYIYYDRLYNILIIKIKDYYLCLIDYWYFVNIRQI